MFTSSRTTTVVSALVIALAGAAGALPASAGAERVASTHAARTHAASTHAASPSTVSSHPATRPASATPAPAAARVALADTPLRSGVPVTASGAANAFTYYAITVPADASSMTVTTAGGTGDVDLYVRAGTRPTTSSYDCRPYRSGNAETCTLAVKPGTYYIGLQGYSAYSGVTLTAKHNGTDQAPASTVLSNGTPVTVTGAAGSMSVYTVSVPAGASNLVIGTSGGTGDVDLHVKAGTGVSTTSFDCRPYRSGSDETCTIPTPTPGTYSIGLQGYSAYSGVQLSASWQAGSTEPGPAPDTTTPPEGPWGQDLSLGRSRPTEDSKYPQMSNPEVDALRYHLDLDWNGSTLKGVTTMDFRATQATSSIRLDLLDSLAVSKVTLDGQPVTSSRDTNGLRIATGALTADSQHRLVITYAGSPHGVKMPSSRQDVGQLGWTQDLTTGDISTNQEPYGAFTWYPSNDTSWDKAYYTASITAPTGKQGVFNGKRTATSTAADGRTVNTFVLDKPSAAYLTTIAIGSYSLETRTMSDGTPFNLWYEPQDAANLPTIWSRVNTAWNWLDSHMSAYPFASAGMVITGKGSAMETQTLVTMNRRYATETAVILHETAHQWNGDSVTTWDWTDLWLNEGWALFWEYEWSGAVSDAKLGADCASSVTTGGAAGDFDPNSFGEYNVYACGARAMRAIRAQVGSSAFTAMATSWQTSKKYQNATRAEFIAHVKATTGYDPTSILDNWLGDNPR